METRGGTARRRGNGRRGSGRGGGRSTRRGSQREIQNGGNDEAARNTQGRDVEIATGDSGTSSNDETCPVCKETVRDDDDAVECSWCKGWEHAHCADLDEDDYQFVDRAPSKCMWFCSDCHRQVNTTLKFVNEVRKQHVDLNERIKVVEEDVKKIKGQATLNEDRLDAVIDNKIEDKLNDLQEREKRAKNLIWHNLPEPEGSDANERKQADISLCSKILSDVLKIKEAKVEGAIRLGKYDSERARPRLLKVVVSSEKVKAVTLTKASELRKTENPTYKKLFITPDLTPLQREKDRKLRLEKQQREEAGETDLIIRRGKVMKRPTQQENSQGPSNTDPGGQPSGSSG